MGNKNRESFIVIIIQDKSTFYASIRVSWLTVTTWQNKYTIEVKRESTF